VVGDDRAQPTQHCFSQSTSWRTRGPVASAGRHAWHVGLFDQVRLGSIGIEFDCFSGGWCV